MCRLDQPQCNKRTAYTDLYIFIEFELVWARRVEIFLLQIGFLSYWGRVVAFRTSFWFVLLTCLFGWHEVTWMALRPHPCTPLSQSQSSLDPLPLLIRPLALFFTFRRHHRSLSLLISPWLQFFWTLHHLLLFLLWSLKKIINTSSSFLVQTHHHTKLLPLTHVLVSSTQVLNLREEIIALETPNSMKIRQEHMNSLLEWNSTLFSDLIYSFFFLYFFF